MIHRDNKSFSKENSRIKAFPQHLSKLTCNDDVMRGTSAYFSNFYHQTDLISFLKVSHNSNRSKVKKLGAERQQNHIQLSFFFLLVVVFGYTCLVRVFTETS